VASVCVPNIGPAGRRRRLLTGVVMLTAAAAGAVWLVAADMPRPWRLMLALPILLGLLGVLQARDRTCVALAARGLRDMDSGSEPIGGSADLERVKAQARRVNLTALLAGTLVMLVVMALP
jgi:hypothetical protein